MLFYILAISQPSGYYLSLLETLDFNHYTIYPNYLLTMTWFLFLGTSIFFISYIPGTR